MGMIFWILLVLVIGVVVIAFWANLWDGDIVFAVLGSLVAAIVAGFVALLLMALLSIWFGPTPHYKGEKDHELVALQTSSSVEGRSFFLGSGYINGKRTLNYITNDDGAYRVESADASDSVVYQDAAKPTVTVHEWDLENPWFAPFSFSHSHTYTFHVPEGSILSDYTLDNE